MKKLLTILNIGFSVIATILVFTYLGYKLNHMTIGIIVGFILSISYLLILAFKR